MTIQKKTDGVAEDAKFIGWQETSMGEAFPLYNITVEDHPSNGSTVTDTTLSKLNLKVPDAPPPQDTEK